MRFFFLVSMWSICGWSMIGDDLDNKSYQTTQPQIELNPVDSARQQLIQQCDAYLVYLEKIFGCAPCKIANSIFNAKAYDHTEIRKKQLKHLKAILTTGSDEGPKLFRDYINALNFKGAMGKSFRQSCLNTIQLNIPDLHDDENLYCIICMDNIRTVIAFPCAHYQSCETCFKATIMESKDCSVCRSSIKSYRVLPTGVLKCALCQVHAANMLTRTCGHIAICSICAGQNNKGECPICFLKDQPLSKIFY